MLQASVTGAIDFSKAELLDRHWWIKLYWVLNFVEEQHLVELYKLQHAHHLAVLDYSVEQEVLEKHWKESNEFVTKISNIRFPWLSQQTNNESRYGGLLDAWKKQFGDIKDPVVKEKFAKVAKAYKEKARRGREKAANTVSPMQKLNEAVKRRRKKKNRR